MKKDEFTDPTIQELLDMLLKNAEELVAVSSHDVSESELQRLQQVQESLLAQLQEYGEDVSRQTYVSERLEQFIQLNRKYVENLARSWGVLDFYKDKVKTITEHHSHEEEHTRDSL